jgi:cell wall-associated NlpC family hydrolase
MAETVLYAIATTVDILGEPDSGHHIGKNDSQLLYGEGFEVEREQGIWVYGRSAVDGYTGYVQSAYLGNHSAPTHFVDVALSHLYPEPNFKSRPLMPLSFLSRVKTGASITDGFVQTDGGAWIFEEHIRKLNALSNQDSLLDSAMTFLNTPYLYGGRAATGIDCSGLVQLAALRSGLSCPRDSADQEQALGQSVPFAERARGDLVFFKGHVGILSDADNVLNATARHMTTLIEPLDALINVYGDVTAIRRVS